jgi:hypothetical protein
VGLVVIGAGTLDLGRRLVLKLGWRDLAPAVFLPWLTLGAAGALAYGISAAADLPSAATMALVVLATGAATATLAYRTRPWRSRLTT